MSENRTSVLGSPSQSVPVSKVKLPSQWKQWLIIFLGGFLGIALGYQQGLTDKASNFLGIFIGTILGLIFHPIPGQALVLMGILLTAMTGILPIDKALSGYSEPIVWLVLSSCLFSRGMIKTQLGKRISLLLIRVLGKSTLGLGCSLAATDLIMGAVIPSNGARSGGVIFPIAKSLCEVYDSKPGPTAKKIGSFLMTLLYQADVIVCATFLTGQASNILIAKLAKQVAGVEISYGTWLLATLVPAIVSMIACALLLYKFFPPEIKSTPAGPSFAREELKKMGPMTLHEKMMLGVFGMIAVLWMTTSIHHLNYTVIAIFGICVLLLAGVIEWNDIVSEKGAWDIYIWYGGLIMLATTLQDLGITQHFAGSAAKALTGQPWPIAVAALLLIYFYAHYWFASVTAHVAAMFVPFLTVACASGAPAWLTVILFGLFSNLCACLTHFGTTPGPIYFGAGYVSQGTWWKIGFWFSILHIVIWGGVGLVWWKVLGQW
jgi:DASS family divalent anion:Na+ symporter